ncbi:P-loop containing nucleoside triphosphate hydrolase protein [Gymnopilus junonius]|uniref:P-loop containing nucleoside triphosphate hydrolase protein n=1 Tax=Gymnopilus junonius TaxID=109634 RepID=A0A9P5TP96_GYMJU|nr:P-loop containing nucleoside triphosphate hydrolase protein [Gymnopilus junonius]
MPIIDEQSSEDSAAISNSNLHQIDDSDNQPNATRVQYLSWGIFNIAYEASSHPLFLSLRFPRSYPIADPSKSLFVDLAFKDELMQQREEITNHLQLLVFAWLFCGLMTHRVENIMIELRPKIGGSLRAHFLPKLVKAHLEWDPDALQTTPEAFPCASDFGDFIPGWDFFAETFDRLRHTTAVILEVFTLIFITCLFYRSFEAYILSGLLLLFFINALLFPVNGAGGVGYTFWTKNTDYNRLMALFNVVFDHKYRFNLVKDGLVDYLIKEYNDVSEALGVVEADTWSALCALFIPWATSRSILSAMIIFQYAIFNMRDSIDILKHARARSSLLVLWKRAETLYQVIDRTHKTIADQKSVDGPLINHAGANITFSNLSYKYPHSSSPAIDNVNLTIKPGQVIVITGSSGSGKTTLMKLLCGLLEATEGEILVNGEKITKDNSSKIRRAITFIGQSEVIYPLPLKENILLGLANPYDCDIKDEEELKGAAFLAGCSSFFEEYENKVLDPCSIPSYSFQQSPGKAAIEALEKEMGTGTGRRLSLAETQTIFATRGFMRVRNANMKLVILDDPFNALDTMAGRAIFENFQNIARERGQTIIIVTHQLSSVTKADMIL